MDAAQQAMNNRDEGVLKIAGEEKKARPIGSPYKLHAVLVGVRAQGSPSRTIASLRNADLSWSLSDTQIDEASAGGSGSEVTPSISDTGVVQPQRQESMLRFRQRTGCSAGIGRDLGVFLHTPLDANNKYFVMMYRHRRR